MYFYKYIQSHRFFFKDHSTREMPLGTQSLVDS